jgi:antitoxin PrlF
MIISKLTSKVRTTIPQLVVAALRLGEGDALEYKIRGRRVILTKAKGPIDHPFRSVQEWHSDADAKAYADLRAGRRP